MTFLPIVGRELRVASRKRFTYFSRVSAAILALIVFGMFQVLLLATGGMLPFNAGQIQFAILKWMAFAFAAGIGVFLTSDSLSEEKREGTLGLLFLTDLHGYDVVLGKFMSQLLRAFYGLLGAFPVLAMCLLSGGVTGAEFWRTMLVICNTLFLSLAIGMFVSLLSRDSTKAMNGAMVVSLLVYAGLPLADQALCGWDASKFRTIFSLGNPFWLFGETGAWPHKQFWLGLAVQHLLGWALLAFASVRAPRAWQEKAAVTSGPRSAMWYRLRFGGNRPRTALRRKWLDRDPILWLALRDRWMARLVLLLALLLVILCVLGIYLGEDLSSFMVLSQFQFLFTYGLMLWVAALACRFFVDAIRSGALELILVTPVDPARIVGGQWMALVRTFSFSALIVALIQLIAAIGVYYQTRGMWAGSVTAGMPVNYATQRLISDLAGILMFIGNLVAMSWFGMWMGLTTRKHTIAVLKTICFVGVLPAVAIFFTVSLIIGYLALAGVGLWMPMLLWTLYCIFSLVKDAFFVVWARRRLMHGFRDAVARAGMGTTYRTLLPVPRATGPGMAPAMPPPMPPVAGVPPPLPRVAERVKGPG